ncbi:glycosyltransferase [Pontibacter sp. G13]|uniref:glycosyltransferase n=1 Tax=Pontibacter sp. G13 TaxID=3074898 RepID=UPI00288988CD|nr:glycosyltransferase [Pontibacter sp. G13]WNJ19755.1 glycosyltransferase [Pontibacter sp. G13]
MTARKIHVVQAGVSGFPFASRAVINKQIAMAQGLKEANVEATVVNKKGIYEPTSDTQYPADGNYKGIDYYTASGTAYRPSGFVKRNLLKFRGMMNEIKLYKRMAKENKLDALILDTSFFNQIIYYRILSKLFGFQLVYHYVEMRSKIDKPGKKLSERLDNYLTDSLVTKLFDAVLPISDVLKEWVEERDPETPMFKVPVLCDYTQFDIPREEVPEPYFLYCGTAAYSEVVDFILDAFGQLETQDDMYLYLIISGPKPAKQKIFDKIAKHPKSAFIRTFSNIPYEELVHKYVHASGLLIPLRPTVQDAARFPFKVGEYLATGNPVITTNYGELKAYFTDQHDALVADSYDVSQYVDKMKFVLEHPDEAREIGLRGKEMGYSNFHYSIQGKRMRSFLEKLCFNGANPQS